MISFKNNYSVNTFWDDEGSVKVVPKNLSVISGSVLEHLNESLRTSSYYQSVVGLASTSKVLVDVLNSPVLSCGGSLHGIGRKWGMAVENGVKYLIVNGTEGEPFTFKDYQIMRDYPHLVIESITTVAALLGVKEVRFAINASYTDVHSIIEKAWDRFRENNITLDIAMIIRKSPDLYISGEETSLINLFEGKRGEPRLRGVLPMESGLFGKPTLVSNVETLCWVLAYLMDNQIFNSGVKKISTIVWGGDTYVCELKIGTTFFEIAKSVGIDSASYVEVGGVSGSMFLMEQLQDVEWSNVQLSHVGASVGSGSLRFFDAKHDIEQEVLSSLRFFDKSTCGQCTPCRVGTQRLVSAFDGKDKDLGAITKTATTMRMTSLCGLGKSAATPVCSYIRNIYGTKKK